jgi:hypothetical protein
VAIIEPVRSVGTVAVIRLILIIVAAASLGHGMTTP